MKRELVAKIEEGMSSAEVSVPFSWESQPGTPRTKFYDSPSLPPLTPPPSYYYNVTTTPTTSIKKHSRKPKLLTSIFQRRCAVIRRTSSNLPSSPSPSSSSSSSSQSWSTRRKPYSVPSSPMTAGTRQFYSKEVEDEEGYEESTVSTTLCFGRTASAGSRGCWCSSFIKIVVR